MNKEYKFTYKGFPIEIRIVDRYPPMCEIWYLDECMQISLKSQVFNNNLRDNLRRILTYIDEAEYLELLADKFICKCVEEINEKSCI